MFPQSDCREFETFTRLYKVKGGQVLKDHKSQHLHLTEHKTETRRGLVAHYL